MSVISLAASAGLSFSTLSTGGGRRAGSGGSWTVLDKKDDINDVEIPAK